MRRCGARRRLQPRERGDAIRDESDPVRLRPVGERGEGKPVLRRQRVLERDRAREHAAIELRQHHMHGEIGGAQPARAVAPGRALGGRDHDLQHRHAGPSSGVGSPGSPPAANAVVVRMTAGASRASAARMNSAASRLLEARDHERRRREAARGQRLAQRVDRRGIGRKQQRPIEDDRHHRPAGRKLPRRAGRDRPRLIPGR